MDDRLVAEIIALAEAKNDEGQRISEAVFGPGSGALLNMADPRWAKVLATPRPARAALLARLESLDDETVRNLEALMYVGRGDLDSVAAMREHLGMTRAKVISISTMMEKAPLAEYLTKGIFRTKGKSRLH